MFLIKTLLWSLTLKSEPLNEIFHKYNVEISDFEHGRGLKTLSSRSVGDILLSVPSSYALSKKIVYEKYKHIKDLQCNLTDTQVMALGILSLKQEDSIIVCTLPESQYSIPLMPEQLIKCLPSAYQKIIKNIREYYNRVYEKICKEESKFNFKLTAKEFYWAIASVQSRSFKSNNDNDGSNESRVMIPGIDLINHKFSNGAFMSYNPDSSQYEVRACVPLSQGDEITISYGDIDNLNLFINFGFCIPANPNRIIFFDLDDILRAAQSLIPNIYPDAIIQNFKKLLDEEKKYPDLFEYDGNDNVLGPRACLKQAAMIVRHLGERLADIKFDGLENAIIRRTLVTRKEELVMCLKEIGNTVVEEEWTPFVSSIHSLLHDEFEILK